MNVTGPPDRPATRPHRFGRFSLSRKVPLVAGFLILAVASSVSISAYFEVRHAARQAAIQHVRDLSRMVGSTQRTDSALVATAHAVATLPAVVVFSLLPDSAHRLAALSALASHVTGGSVLMGTELLDASGRVLLTTNPALDGISSDFPPVIAANDTASVGKIRMVHDSIGYPVSMRVPGSSGAYVVQWRHATSAARTRTQTQQAIGAAIILGNVDGSYWTDLDRLVPAPVANLHDTTATPVEYTRDVKAGAVIATVLRLRGTPWAMAVEIPLREVMAPADKFLRAMLVVTLILVAIALVAAWAFARRLTVPLEHLTNAADNIAAGRRTGEMPVAREDELGRLATSFTVMSQQVHESRQRLEEKVTERTGELHAALHQLRETQEALVRREKLAILGQLAGGVGHELRNPLGVMSNAIYYLELVLQSSPDNVKDYLRLLREQVTLSSKIVGDLLDFARVTPVQRKAVSLREIVDAQVARLPKNDAVRVEVDLDDSLPPADVDPVHLGQVVFNLLTNAMQAMDGAGGRLQVSAASSAEQQLSLIVTDSGPGIAADVIDRIFEPLFTTTARGIGLGLAVSRALAQANDGDISVTSVPGHGARFTVTMPAAAAVAA